MANLGPQHINTSYGDLLQLPNGLTGSLQAVQDGSGNTTPLEISNTIVDFPIESVSGSTGAITDLPSATGSQYLGFEQSGTSAVLRSAEDKMRDVVSITDFGAVGNGSDDDTDAINAALAASKHVIVPAGMTCLISSTITVPSQTKLEFLGGLGNLAGALPASYFIKKSTMTTAGIVVATRGMVTGGGINGQVGNAGDGIQLAGNGAVVRDFYACRAGRDGVRVGTDGTYANCNSTFLSNVRSTNNGRYGFYIHDGVAVGPADANAGSLIDCIAISNGSDGIRLGHCFWVSVINALCESNTGYGLYLSGVNNNSYPECRWANIVGGDFNEGNNSTVNVNQVYDSSYFSTFINSDPDQFPTNTTTTGLQGAGVRSQYGAASKTSFYGGTFYTGSSNTYPVFVDGGVSGTTFNGLTLQKMTTGSNGNGIGLGWSISPGGVNPYVQAGEIQVTQNTTDQYGMTFNVYRGGALPAMEINANAYTFRPQADNTWSLGTAGLRWSVVFAATGTINTSDERTKQQIKPIDDSVLKAWAKVEYCQFKFNDAVEKKSDGARWHIGLIAQRVKEAFESEGLDAFAYGLLCYDEWESGNRYGIRYEEALALECAYLRSKLTGN